MEKKRFVIDIDDTVSACYFADYQNALPKPQVIEVINNLYKEGHYIIMLTARGMVTCDGDIARIEKKNRKLTEDWLNRNGVLYHELHFGKPIGAHYIDDKALPINDFIRKYSKIPGGSHATVEVNDEYVVKTFPGGEIDRHVDWMKKVEEQIDIPRVRTPKIIKVVGDDLYMEKIPGPSLYDCNKPDNFLSVLDFIDAEAVLDGNGQPFETYLKKMVEKVPLTCEVGQQILRELYDIEPFMNMMGSFGHDDLTLANIISNDEGIFIIDPNNKDYIYTSWIMDIARLRMSTNSRYESIFFQRPVNPLHTLFNNIIELRYKDVMPFVKILEKASLYRLIPYKPHMKHHVLRMIENV